MSREVVMQPKIILVTLGLVAAITSTACGADGTHEPTYEGKTVGVWVECLKNARNDDERRAAADAISGFGRDAEPAVASLLPLLDDRSEKFRSIVAMILCRIGPAARFAVPSLAKALKDRTAHNPKEYIAILGAIGPAASKAVPVLVDMLGNSETREAVVRALCSIGPGASKSIPAIARALQEMLSQTGEGKNSDCTIVYELAKLGTDAVPLLVEYLNNKNRCVQSWSTKALATMGKEAKIAVPALTKILKDRNLKLRIDAASALWRIEQNRTGIPVLALLLTEDDDEVSIEAAEALAQIGPAAKESVPRLMEALGHREPKVQIKAAIALWKVKKDTSGVPVLASLLANEKKWYIPVYAADALGEIGPAAKQALPALLRARANNPNLENTVDAAISKIDPDGSVRGKYRPSPASPERDR
jgi:HEAT repeat protein